MAKLEWKPGNMLYPLPAVMVSCRGNDGCENIITIGWTGTTCSSPAMTYVSVRPDRFSHHLIEESGEFVINLTTRELARATDYCGVKSGKDVDKFEVMGLHKVYGSHVKAPMIAEAPVSLECKVTEIHRLGSHDMFMAEIVGVYVDDKYMDEKGKFHMTESDLMAYCHGEYFTLGESLGTFGFSVRKK